MKILLLKNVAGLGRAGEIREATEGYALNFLIPNGLAERVTKHGEKMNEQMRAKSLKVKSKEVKNKKNLARKINSQSFIIEAKTDEKGTLYARVSEKDIAGLLLTSGFNVEEREIITPEIKKLGRFEVGLKLGGERAAINLEVRSTK